MLDPLFDSPGFELRPPRGVFARELAALRAEFYPKSRVDRIGWLLEDAFADSAPARAFATADHRPQSGRSTDGFGTNAWGTGITSAPPSPSTSFDRLADNIDELPLVQELGLYWPQRYTSSRLTLDPSAVRNRFASAVEHFEHLGFFGRGAGCESPNESPPVTSMRPWKRNSGFLRRSRGRRSHADPAVSEDVSKTSSSRSDVSDEGCILDQAIGKISDPALRARIAREVELVQSSPRCGFVFDRHRSQAVRLPDHPIRKGVTVTLRNESTSQGWQGARLAEASRSLAVLDDDRRRHPPPQPACWAACAGIENSLSRSRFCSQRRTGWGVGEQLHPGGDLGSQRPCRAPDPVLVQPVQPRQSAALAADSESRDGSLRR